MTAPILLVDDRRENLVALEAILEPLGQPLVSVQSGEEALRELLRRDFAVILLDVQMPELDGFETARLVKERERTRHVPIIFLTAISKETKHVFEGYTTGAVDYLFKPFVPEILRAKVQVFVDLYLDQREVEKREEELRRRELEALEREAAARFRDFIQGLDAIFWEADAETWEFTFVSHHAEELLGYPVDRWLSDPRFWSDVVVHPDDREWVPAHCAAETGAGRNTDFEYRALAADGRVVWVHDYVVVVPAEEGRPGLLRGVMLDVTRRKEVEAQRRFLLDAGEALGSSLDYHSTLRAVVELAVPSVADWCAVDVLEQGGLARLAVKHVDGRKAALAEELHERFDPGPDAGYGAAAAIASGDSQLFAVVDDEALQRIATSELHLEVLRELGVRSFMCVPIEARGRRLGALSFALAESPRNYGDADLALAEELARRAATAIDNAQLYREAEARARAAQVLAAIADGVFLVDGGGVIRLWNPAAEEITGVPAVEAAGQRAALVLPGWDDLSPRIGVRPETFPLDLGGRELWLSISGVPLGEGTAYAFRDLTEERALEELKADFVATVSHELRTPLAAIYGSAQTIRRPDLELGDDIRNELLGVIADESDRLANIVNDLLLASHLDSGRLPVKIEHTDAGALVRGVVDSARARLPENLALELRAPKRLPRVAADPGQLRQVLVNLVDNAIKYSPDGGLIEVALERHEGAVRFVVRDEGLGIPLNEQRRVFEKFYRLDPNMTRGIGGTGLGLYICRELVRRVNGSIRVESKPGKGSEFSVDIPAVRAPARQARAAAQA